MICGGHQTYNYVNLVISDLIGCADVAYRNVFAPHLRDRTDFLYHGE
jgi:hypothetical protein